MKVIDVEDTPNPEALKFVLDGTLLENGVRQFDSAKSVNGDPLAASLFSIPGVESVFYMGRFVTVAKKPDIKWMDLQPSINKAIAESADRVSGSSHSTSSGSIAVDVDDPKMMEEINRVLDENVRPALAGDGGGLEVLGLDKYVLTIHYQGACGSCPSATMGTMAAVQNLLQRMVDPRLKVVNS